MADRLDAATDQIEAMRELNALTHSEAHIEDELDRKFRKLETNRAFNRLAKSTNNLDELKRRLDEE